MDVSPELRSVLEAVRCAPSAHNTQPWQLEITGPESFRVGWNLDRWLEVGDPKGEQLGYSLGCAIEAAHSVARIEIEPSGQADLLTEGGYAARVRVKGAAESGDAARLLQARVTHRAQFLPDPVATSTLREIARCAERHGVGASIVAERGVVRRVGELASAGALACLRRDAYVRELLDWMRFTRSERERDPDGFTPETLLLDPVSAGVTRWMRQSELARRWVPRLGMARIMGARTASAVRRSGALVLLSTANASVDRSIAGGRALMSVWLAATRAGLALQPVHFPIATPELRDETLRAFGCDTASHPITMVRIGVARRAAPASDRLPLERICTLVESPR